MLMGNKEERDYCMAKLKNLYCWGINPIRLLFLNPIEWYEFYAISGSEYLSVRLRKEKIRYRHYGGKEVQDAQTSQKLLADAIRLNKPYMAGRLGAGELEYCYETQFYKQGLIKNIRVDRLERTCVNNGFFPPTAESFQRFSDLMEECIKDVDLLGVSYMTMEGFYCRRYLSSEAVLTERRFFDFWDYDEPFTSALEGKRVLVIHPFEKTIREQYQNREMLYDKDRGILPQFKLDTIKAVQTGAGGVDDRFDTWFDALDYMTDEALKREFDVALIGCGAYGFPLAHRLKQAGKVAIHMGGVTQMLFGIKGKRWDIHPTASRLYNEYWKRPALEDTPPSTDKVENSCYW